MKLKVYLYIPVLLIILAGCCHQSELKQPVNETKSWQISITGTVKDINLVNVDKSGKNPQFIIHFTVKIENYDDGGWGTILGPEMKFVCKENDLPGQPVRRLNAGERVLIKAHIIENSPQVIAVQTIKFL